MTLAEDIAQVVILDHYRNPRHRGLRTPYDAESRQVNPTCGDEVTVRVALDGGTVVDVSYDALGCSISQASTSVMTELVIGRSSGQVAEVSDAFRALMHGRGTVAPDEDVLEDAVVFAGVSRYPARVTCALLGWMAMQDALARASSKQEERA